jgi:parvulin-like peptidyl-prolyl isomerase
VGSLPADEAVALLERRIGEARAAGVRDYSPTLKKSLALLGTLAAAAGSASSDDAQQKSTDPQQAAIDALFGGGYAPPGELDF